MCRYILYNTYIYMLIYIHGTYCQYTYVNYIYTYIYIYTLRQAAEDQDPDLDRLLEALLEAWVIMDMSPRKKRGNVIFYLVGGLEHGFYFSIYWECHHPN